MGNMVLRLTDEDTEQLREAAEREHRSMHDVALTAVREHLQERHRIQDEFLDQFVTDNADAMDRLARG